MTDERRPTAPPGARAEINYASYLALGELLALQRPLSLPEHPDELLFIVVHQASELWFKVILHELECLVTELEAYDVMRAVLAVRRLNALMRIVAAQLSALETLPPQRFAQFRGYLGASSGSQSEQFRAIEAASGLRDPHFVHVITEHGEAPPLVRRWLDRPTLQELFERLLSAQQTTLEELYTGPAPTPSSSSPRGCWSTSSSSRAGGSPTCSSSSGSSGRPRRGRAAR